MSLASFFTSTCETRELHSDASLRTRYYRNSYKQAFEALKSLEKELDFDIRDVNDTHGEIYIISNGYEIIVTMVQVTPIETGIDFKVNTFSAIGFGRPRKIAIQFYKEFDRLLKFKGVALHP